MRAADAARKEKKEMTRIEYSKYFLTGTLAGIAVRCGYNVPDEDAARHSAELQALSLQQRETPARENNGTYYIYNIGSQEVR
jgi:hypothetical protein